MRKQTMDRARGPRIPALGAVGAGKQSDGHLPVVGPSAAAAAGAPGAPVFRVDRNGILLNVNGPGRPLLKLLGRELGERLPDYLSQLIPGVLLSGSSEKAVVKFKGAPMTFTVALSDGPEVERFIEADPRRSVLVTVEEKDSEASALLSLPVALYTARTTGDYEGIWLSPGVQALTGFSPSQFIKQPGLWIARIHKEDRPMVLKHLSGLKATGNASMEYRLQCADGSYKWIMNQAVLVPGEDKLFGIMQDIDARKRCEDGLRESNDFLEMMVAGAAHGVMVLDGHKNLVFLNPSLAGKLGLKTSDWVKKHAKIEFHPKDNETGIETFSRALGGLPGQCEARVRTSGGAYLYFQLCLTPMEWRGTRLVFGVASDISQRKRAETKRSAVARKGLEEVITAAISVLAPGLPREAALKKIKGKLGSRGRELLKDFV